MRVRRGKEDVYSVGERPPYQMHLLLLLLCLSPALALNALYKGYSGTRLRNDSLLLVYHYEQTFAVVEIGKNREMFNCELIEAYETSLQKELLKNLTALGKTYKIRFSSMLDLMNRCDELPPIRPLIPSSTTTHHPITDATGSILNGVLPDLKKKMHSIRESFSNRILEPVPLMPFYLYYVVLGTRWCGNGDIASSYYDLGTERSDRCCRKHDLCPIKVRNTSPKYGITNKGYSLSHCECDYEFYKCLKRSNSSVGLAMEYLYFELLQTMCLEGTLSKGFRLRNSHSYALAKKT